MYIILQEYKRIIINKNLYNYCSDVKAFISGNGFKGNLVIFLGLLSYTIIGIDFDTECSVEKNEIDYVVAVLNKTIKVNNVDVFSILICAPPSHEFIILFNVSILNSDPIEHPTGRAPPLV